ncbi:cytochrome b/b6 domain-containing protein [Roseateles asaccharophilus]|uniref:Cytochrome b561 n=1 Tax=Roseateles asaccharophilus TaxID=582607 RepID=A0ABU2ADN0_9BURK|nr:cytochrome b/b6 domain-containing protein [Roseateles asaccharophilus]MDR7335294.1 cytochrome b561 [Roseateles asaccharophilus]
MNLVQAIEWAEGHHRRGLYSPIGVAFHWVMAALMIFQLGYGWWLGRLPVGGDKLLGYQTHAEVGLTLMVLGSLRFLWRSQIGTPENVDEDSLSGKASHAVEVWFYFSFFALPISGWVMWSTLPGDLPLSIAGVIPVPNLPFHQLSEQLQFTLMQGAATAHLWIVWITALSIPGHAGAAVLHYVFKRDRVLPSMLDLNGPDQPGVVGSATDSGSAREPRRH